MSSYSIDEFVRKTGQKDITKGKFGLERERFLEVNLSGVYG